ncbi:MAG TPA: hypothetical protein VM370_00150 [Candidatus Thermoplasmatota archaeon]|nr:hypothetical protein [Candidatus Thermoplasmatota archaeon]
MLALWAGVVAALRAWDEHRDARAIYGAVARAAWDDGVVSRGERRILDRLAPALRLLRVEAWWVERVAARSARR